MDNIPIDDFINSMEPLFKEITGLDLHNHTQEEYEEWYHGALKKEAENDKYTKEILKMTEDIIENKEYSTLSQIMRNYDALVKGKYGYDIEGEELPYWCYCLGSFPQEE